jgi:hypothetical protein
MYRVKSIEKLYEIFTEHFSFSTKFSASIK